MGANVEIRGLTRQFEGTDRPAVADLSLAVRPGETLCLVGPSGCGKSTTLRLIAGLDRPDRGEIRIDGRDMSGVEPQERDVAMVFQGFALYPHMKVADILAFPLKMRGVKKSEQQAAVSHAAELLGITPLLERRPAQLSGGERQRVAMGRALVRRPKVFLFDEPLSNLDAALRVQLRAELARLLRRLKATAVYVTHDQAEAMTLGHRIALLRAGRLEQIDSPRRIYEAPETAFCAGFFGAPAMNVIDGEVQEGVASAAGWLIEAPRRAEGSVLLGIRPEHLRLLAQTEEPPSRWPAARARVVSVEPLGAETHVAVESGGARLLLRVEGFETPSIDEVVTVALDPSKARWFDKTTGQAL